MAKAKTAYVCTECGAHSVKWAGQCPDCAAWNTLAQTRIASRASNEASVEPSRLESLPDDLAQRHASGFAEFDRVLGGGLVPGAVVLLGGDPGVGKSTLLQQVSAALSTELTVLYATGEESLRQFGQRSQRLGLASAELHLLADTSLENVLEQARGCKAWTTFFRASSCGSSRQKDMRQESVSGTGYRGFKRIAHCRSGGTFGLLPYIGCVCAFPCSAPSLLLFAQCDESNRRQGSRQSI